jgi:hypothetical protein
LRTATETPASNPSTIFDRRGYPFVTDTIEKKKGARAVAPKAHKSAGALVQQTDPAPYAGAKAHALEAQEDPFAVNAIIRLLEIKKKDAGRGGG